jgi:hypothetical protein
MAPTGIEPATFRLVVQYLNQVCHELAHVIKGTKSFMDFRRVTTIEIK